MVKKMIKLSWLFILNLVSILALASAPEVDLNEGNNSSEKGLIIAQKSDWHYQGYEDSIASLNMILTQANGTEATRELRIKTFEIPEDGDKSIVIFDSPSDQRGVALLSYAHKVEADDQFLYLPALKRVKKLASRNKSGPFVGSEFAFEDVSRQEVEKYNYDYTGIEVYGDDSCYKLVKTPKDPYSGYSYQVHWIEQKNLLTKKIDFYDKKESLLKTLEFTEYKKVNGYWRAMKSIMTNHQNQKSTTLIVNDLQISSGLEEREFTKNALKRAK